MGVGGRNIKQITYRLQVLLLFLIERPSLDGDNLGRRFWVVRNGRAALAAEDAVNRLARGAGVGIALCRARDVHLVLLENGDEGCEVVRALGEVLVPVLEGVEMRGRGSMGE